MGEIESERSKVGAVREPPVHKYMKGRIIEIFSSIQGEGMWVGKPQVFVRFHGCKLKCQYCDTPLTHHKITESRIETIRHSNKFIKHSLEYDAHDLNEVIQRFEIPSIAITGGEPLEQFAFIKEWLSSLNGQYTVLLETNGVEVEAMKEVLPLVHIISIDLKIPSATGEGSYWKEHRHFLETVRDRSHYAKVVYDEKITHDELENINQLMTAFEELNLIFQPVSPLRQRNMDQCLETFYQFSKQFSDRVRLIPQMHKMISVR